MYPPPIYFQLPPTVCGEPQDHSQAQRFARTDRTQKSCYTHGTVYYSKGMQLEIRKSHIGRVQEKPGTSSQVCPPGGVRQGTLNILSTMMCDYICGLFQLGKSCVQAFIVGQSCTYAASVWVIPATQTAVLLSAETSRACPKPSWTTKLLLNRVFQGLRSYLPGPPQKPFFFLKPDLCWMCRIWATQSCWVNSYFPWVYSLQRWLLKVREMLLKTEDRKHHHSSAQKPWASLVGQTGKNPPSMREIQVQSLGWEDPLEKEMATYSSILAWRISMDRAIWQATVHGATKSQTWLSN